ncbi:regulator of G-protein signaling loco isoform X2 [Phymastichus coffea]|uniref:regulator of G-protein signaling loco isoform X2 n=1 Tax=Phymastichus coffea TaxID=108790 RepID=UPI00273ABCE6|nr:regulator of G-protein signaling loco isoform X2 [Phymastichus coffea]
MQQPQQQHQEPDRPVQLRRKKKRRTVQLVRGDKGFGFTISGQQPCILSAIEPDSPAELAGLRTGNVLVAVNGHCVTTAFHDDVVLLIGRSHGLLKLRILTEVTDDSDSSDDDDTSYVKARARPRYRSRSSTTLASAEMSTSLQPQCRIAKVVRDLHSGAMFNCRMSVPNLHRWSMSSPPLPPPPPASRKCDSEKIVHRAVLGYLGTIDIPNHLQSMTMMSLVRKCIKRIKTESRNLTTVLLTIHVANIKLTNMEGRLIAEYSSNRIVYCNSFPNEDKLHFGILTKIDVANTNETNNCEIDNASNSCHVFKIYTNITDHSVHCNMSDIFGFSCTKASEPSNACQEFPSSCEGLVGAIQTLYIADTTDRNANLFDNRWNHRDAQSSPQPSNISTSTAHSSNSDSGIGFKDDCCCHLDRNFNAELPPRYHDRSIVVSSLGRNKDYSGSKLTVRAISDSRWNNCPRPFKASHSASLSDQQLYSNELEDYPEARILAHCQHLKESRRRRSGGSGSARYSSGGEGSIISCPANVPSAAPTRNRKQQRTSPKALAALARSPRYTSALSVGTLQPNTTPNTRSQLSKSNGNFFGLQRDMDVPDRLSPKVYPNGMKIQGYSMENLKTSPGSKSQSDYSTTTKSLPHSHTGSKAGNDKPPRAWGSLQEIRKVAGCEHDDYLLNHGSNESCDKATGCGVHTWALSFEKLLEDPKGLQTFAKYLKKEISHENIYFWAACERYSDTEDLGARKKLAAQIYEKHLSNNAPEPVNVDSQAAGQITMELLESAPTDVFAQAQKQVFNLMKFDSYPRFLRSDIYRRCLEYGHDPEDSTPEDGDLILTNSPSLKIRKSRSDVEDRNRKSILPWHRKNRSKSKDRGESEYNKTPNRGEKIYKSFSTIQRDNEGNNNDEDNVSVSSSRSSLASWDLALRQSFTKHSSCEGQSNDNRDALGSKCTGLCRVILPDGSTTVIPTNHSDSVRDVLTRLLDKRALRYANYDVIVLTTDELINLKHPSSVLASQEVEVVPTKVIKVDLPSRRVISVVAHKGKTLKEVLKPLLNKYGFKLELVTIWDNGHPISIDIPASSAPPKLSLTSNNKEIVDDASLFKVPEVPKGQPTLDEITNKVFQELRVGKSTTKRDEEGSCKSDDQKSEKSESSSILSGKIFSRDSTLYLKKKSKSKNSNTSERSTSDCGNEEINRTQPPLIAKWKNGVKLQLPSRFDGDSKDIYDGIKRAQKLRLEDQRGTEINFELPDFLKNKENGKMIDEKKRRKSRSTSSHGDFSKFYDSQEEKPILDLCYDNTSSLETTLVDADQTIENGSHYFDSNKISSQDHVQISSTKLLKPPPLPPKPKSLMNSLRSNALPTRPFQRVVNYDKKTI